MFKLHSDYKPTGDQPQAIEYLSKGIKEGKKFQTLLGVTGSGKTESFLYPILNHILKEIEDVARKISKKISEGYRYSDFAIYTTVPDEYYKVISRIFYIF